MENRSKYRKIFEPGQIGTMTTRNRIVMPSIAYVYPKPDGHVPQRMKDYLEARARGGAGLVIVEYTLVEASPRFAGFSIRIDNDEAIESFAETARLIQKHHAKAGIQLGHVGDKLTDKVSHTIGEESSDGSRNIFPPEGPEVFTVSEIKRIVESFGKAAERAKKAGFDGIEIHAAHGSNLLARFLSPASNKRQDEYGGSTENRIRFLLEVVRSVREAVGDDYPVWCRINGGGTEGLTAALTPDEVRKHARILEQNGVDALSVSGLPDVQSYFSPPGYFVPLAELIKKVVNIPIIATGNISPKFGERILSEGKADFTIMGRALMADPDLPRKTISGYEEDVTPCIKCSFCRFARVENAMKCSVNAAFGMERESIIQPAQQPKNVLIVGGGPAGMEAARVAALRGHNVTLYEKDAELGGQMLLASVPPHKDRISDFTRYLASQVNKLKVKVELGKTFKAEMIDILKPDSVILATGINPFIPQIPGIDRDNVVLSEDVLSGAKNTGQKVVILGGELVACETAQFLCENGKQITLTRRGNEFATKVLQSVKEPLLEALIKGDIRMLSGVTYEGINDFGLIILDKKGIREEIEADTIVLACGSISNTGLMQELEGKVPEIFAIGDCVEPRNIYYAVYEGYHTARTL